MLIFKNNIYDRKELGLVGLSPTPDPDYDEWFDTHHFIESALNEEDEILSYVERQPRNFWKEDTKNFYPYAHKIGGLPVIRNLLRILRDGLDSLPTWYHMNTYHFCFIFDVLVRYSFNYNHDTTEERLKALPELHGKSIYFDSFLKDYFFNTVFLMDEEKYNSLSRDEKIKLGYDCPCQFGVINGLKPTREEMELKKSKDYPYSVYV